MQEAYEGSVGIERIKLMLGNKTVANDQTLNTRKNDGKGEYILHKQDVKIRCYVIPEDELKFWKLRNSLFRKDNTKDYDDVT